VPEFEWVSEDTCLLRFVREMDPAWPSLLNRYCVRLKQRLDLSILDAVTSYGSVWVRFHPLQIKPELLRSLMIEIAEECMRDKDDINSEKGPLRELPLCIDFEYALDLPGFLDSAQMELNEWRSLYFGRIYTVYAIGFRPGFPYLGEVDARIACSRKHTPRLSITEGSVGIADRQTGVYPTPSPGGWNIIGSCPLRLWDLCRDEPSLLQTGDRIRWVEVNRAEHDSIFKSTRNQDERSKWESR